MFRVDEDIEEFFWDAIMAPEMTFKPSTSKPLQEFKPL